MNLFNRHLILKSVAVIITSMALLVATYYLGGLFGYTPHVVLSYFTGGIVSAWSVSAFYDKVVLRRNERPMHLLYRAQSAEITRLQDRVSELERLGDILDESDVSEC